MLPDLKNMSYPERLKILGLTTLESRRLRQRCQLGTMTIRKARPQKKGGKGRKFRLQK